MTEELPTLPEEQIEMIRAARLDKITWLSIEVAILLLFAATLLSMPKWLLVIVYASSGISAIISIIQRWAVLLQKRKPVRLRFEKSFFLFQIIEIALAAVLRSSQVCVSVLCLTFILGHAYMLYREIKNEVRTKE